MRFLPRGISSLACIMALALSQPACITLSTDVTAGAATPATPTTQQANAEVEKAYSLADPATFADAKRGLIAVPTGQVRDANGSVIWDFADFNFVQGKAPATVNPSLWRQAQLNNQVGLFKVTEGVYQLRGFDIANISLIEGKTGWIVVDTLTSRETAAFAIEFARHHLENKPISAVIFTHSHIDHFGGVLGIVSSDDVAARRIPIVAPVGFMAEATSENMLMGTAMGRRAMYMYGSRLPRSPVGLVDNGLGKAVALGAVGILEPTLSIDQPREEKLIDGVRFIFQNAPGSEAPAEMTFYLPDLKAYCGAEVMSHTLHNLYTLRGAKVRDAAKWAQYIDAAIEGDAAHAEVFFGQHHWPVWGHERIQDFLIKQRDSYRYIHDQTVRMMNAGLTASEIAETIKLPESLDSYLNVHGYYGTVKHNVKAVYQYYLGWFDANPADLDPLPPEQAAKRYVELAGGADKLLAVARNAYQQGDYRWSAELLKQLVYAEPGNAEGRALLADSLDQLGYQSEAAPWRNFYLTGAYELRNGPPQKGINPSMAMAMLQHTPIERFLESMAAVLNGPKAEKVTLTINLVFSDLGESYVLNIDNAVLHFHKATPAGNANATLTLTKAFFLQMVTGKASGMDLLMSDQTKIDGSKIDLARFFALFDKPPGNFPIVTRE